MRAGAQQDEEHRPVADPHAGAEAQGAHQPQRHHPQRHEAGDRTLPKLYKTVSMALSYILVLYTSIYLCFKLYTWIAVYLYMR
jgi:hypothetical protein